MRILLLNLPWRRDDRRGVRAGSRWPFTAIPEEGGDIKYIPFPFFLACAASLLKSRDNDTELIDAIARGMDEAAFMEEVSAYRPSMVVIETSTPSFDNDIELAGRIKRNTPGASIVLCGPHATTYAREILVRYDFIDYVLTGEYENTLLELVSFLKRGSELKAVSGLAFRTGRTPVVNKPRPTIKDLDELPWPLRQEETIYKYNDGFAGLPVPNVQMCSSRGCPFRCVFCLWPQVLYKEHRYRKRNPVKVVEEMEWLVKRFNFRAVYFDDDVFNIDKGHVTGICREIVRRGISIPWAVMARADLMSKDLLSMMAEAGLYAVKYGIESANSRVLKLCKKDFNVAHASKMIKYTKELGIKVHLTFCLGLPGETGKSIQETINFVSEMKPDSLQFSLATPFPGTSYYDYLKRSGACLPANLSDYDGNGRYAGNLKELAGLDPEKFKNDLCNNLNLK
ncbi:MAG: radical SAM protein [Candidatus Omnitrophica bacterium]|nr:radical SAM protein [Candidatus Omnitrophota bacterium]MDD5771202.1 radical SAM protein [Candidatus Omnitrophota bacterium]